MRNESINHKKEIGALFKKYIAPLLQVDDYDIVSISGGSEEIKNNFFLEAKINDENNFKIITDLERSPISKIVQTIWKHLFNIYVFINENSNSSVKNYKDSLYESAFVWGISQWLSGGAKDVDKTIYHIIRQFMDWSMKTYEGNRVRFGVVVDTEELLTDENIKRLKINFFDFLTHDAAASISDGVDTYFVVSKEGYIVKVSDEAVAINGDKEAFSPIELTKVCKASVKSNVGICLSASGDIYCFKKMQLKIARLNGKWVGFSYEQFSNAIKDEVKDSNIKEVYNTCLDVSFARTGGCLAICKPQNSKRESLDSILPDINISMEKFPLIQSINNNEFFTLPRLIRKEYMGIDGATILDGNCKVKCVGAIINSVKPGSDGGGRKAATKRLSEFGIAIKISADGYIQILKNGETVKEFK